MPCSSPATGPMPSFEPWASGADRGDTVAVCLHAAAAVQSGFLGWPVHAAVYGVRGLLVLWTRCIFRRTRGAVWDRRERSCTRWKVRQAADLIHRLQPAARAPGPGQEECPRQGLTRRCTAGVDARLRVVTACIGDDAGEGFLSLLDGLDADHHAAGLRFVEDLRRQDLHHHRVARRGCLSTPAPSVRCDPPLWPGRAPYGPKARHVACRLRD